MPGRLTTEMGFAWVLYYYVSQVSKRHLGPRSSSRKCAVHWCVLRSSAYSQASLQEGLSKFLLAKRLRGSKTQDWHLTESVDQMGLGDHRPLVCIRHCGTVEIRIALRSEYTISNGLHVDDSLIL